MLDSFLFIIAVSVWLCWIPVSASEAEADSIYLIAAEPQHYSESHGVLRTAVLYRLEGDALRKTRTIATWRQTTETVQVFHEHGFGVVVSTGASYGSFLLDVLDFSDMSRERSLEIHPNCTNGFCSLLSNDLLRHDGKLIYAIKGKVDVYGGVCLDTGELAGGIDQWNFRTEAYRYGQPDFLYQGFIVVCARWTGSWAFHMIAARRCFLWVGRFHPMLPEIPGSCVTRQRTPGSGWIG